MDGMWRVRGIAKLPFEDAELASRLGLVSSQIYPSNINYAIELQKFPNLNFRHVMMFEDKGKLYLGLSFIAGILITLGFKDVYPDLERRYRQTRRRFSTTLNPGAVAKMGQRVALKDNTDRPTNALPEVEIPEGIEGCIGNTPLFRIKSLSDATGCEILAKAEVLLYANIWLYSAVSDISSFSMAPAIVPRIG
jgi:hypothetical protein